MRAPRISRQRLSRRGLVRRVRLSRLERSTRSTTSAGRSRPVQRTRWHSVLVGSVLLFHDRHHVVSGWAITIKTSSVETPSTDFDRLGRK